MKPPIHIISIIMEQWFISSTLYLVNWWLFYYYQSIYFLIWTRCKTHTFNFIPRDCRILELGLTQSAKILFLPPKYKIIMLPSNHLFFQNCNSNIGLFFIAPCKVITLNPFCYQFYYSFLMALSLKLSLLSLFLALKGVKEQ